MDDPQDEKYELYEGGGVCVYKQWKETERRMKQERILFQIVLVVHIAYVRKVQ